MRVVAYDPLQPVICAWSVEYAEAVGVVFVQTEGNELNVIGSRLFHFVAVSEVIAACKVFPWRKRVELNILPPDPKGTLGRLFRRAELDGIRFAPARPESETVYVTRELFARLNIDEAPREWSDGLANNAELTESIAGYRAKQGDEPETFLPDAKHTWHVYLVRALEVLALWQFAGGKLKQGKPSTELRDRAVI